MNTGRSDSDSSRTINNHYLLINVVYPNEINNSPACFPPESHTDSHYQKWDNLLAIYSRAKTISSYSRVQSNGSSRASTDFGLVGLQAAAAAAVGTLSVRDKQRILQEADQTAFL